MKKILACLAVAALPALGLAACASTPAAAPPAHATLTGVYTGPAVPAGWKTTYARNFATTPGLGDWVVQPGAGATVRDSTKAGAEFGAGVEMTQTNQWAELISSKAVVGPSSFVQGLVYIPSASGKSGNGTSFPAGSTANWPAFWTTGNPWPNNGEIDALEGQTGQSCEQTHYGTSGEINSPSHCSQGYGTGTGWTTISILRQNEQVKVWYGNKYIGQVPLPTNANEKLIFQNQSYSTGTCAHCFGPTLLGLPSTAWLSRVTVSAPSAPAPTPTPTTPTPTPTQTTPTPTPTPTTPTPTPTQTTTSAPPGAFSCNVTGNVNCPTSGDYNSDLHGGGNQSALVAQDEWNITPALKSQALGANGTGDWKITANLAAGNTAVLSYPDSQDTVNSWTSTAGSKPIPISNYTNVVSSYIDSLPANPGASDDYEAAYDIWLGSTAGASWADDQEIMVWTDNHGQTPAGSDTGKTWTDAATGNVYEIWVDSGSTSVSTNNDIVTLVAKVNSGTGSISLLNLYKFLQSSGYTAANAGVDQVDYGFELCSTSGQTETFAVNGYTLNASGTGT